VLCDLNTVVATVTSARDAAMLASVGITPKLVILRRKGGDSTARSSFGIQLETDEKRALLATSVCAIDDPTVVGHARVAEDAPQVGDCVVSVQGMSTLMWTHAEVMAAFAKCRETATVEFIGSTAADAILAACSRAVAAADRRGSGGSGGGGGGGNSSNSSGGSVVTKGPIIESQASAVLPPPQVVSSAAVPVKKQRPPTYAWQTGEDFREKMEARSAQLERMDRESNATVRDEWRALQVARAAMGML